MCAGEFHLFLGEQTPPMVVSEQTIGRLSLYRRLLDAMREQGVQNVYSHQLAERTRVSAAQVRRDLMALGYSGSSRHGYDVRDLLEAVGEFMDAPSGQRMALVGVGNLGRALLAYFIGRRPKLSIAAAFDRDPAKIGRVIHGCRCYPGEKLQEVVRREGITIAIITVPAGEAPAVAKACVAAGVRGLLNFAPVQLNLGPSTCVSNVDLTMSLETVAFFSRYVDQPQECR